MSARVETQSRGQTIHSDTVSAPPKWEECLRSDQPNLGKFMPMQCLNGRFSFVRFISLDDGVVRQFSPCVGARVLIMTSQKILHVRRKISFEAMTCWSGLLYPALKKSLHLRPQRRQADGKGGVQERLEVLSRREDSLRGTRSTAEIELMSSTSRDACELWNGPNADANTTRNERGSFHQLRLRLERSRQLAISATEQTMLGITLPTIVSGQYYASSSCVRWIARHPDGYSAPLIDGPGFASKIRYLEREELGKGASGEVWKVVDVDSGEYLARKRIMMPDTVNRAIAVILLPPLHAAEALARIEEVEVLEQAVSAFQRVAVGDRNAARSANFRSCNVVDWNYEIWQQIDQEDAQRFDV
ncbi:hypothetical protein ACJZ2D_006575 [Fusarium nematophilum]